MPSTGEYYETYWSEEGFQPAAEPTQVLEDAFAAHVRAGDECIDVGCGDGRSWGTWLTCHGAHYVGVDISQRAVDAARRRGLDAKVVNDASELPFPDCSFDAAACIEVLEHLFEPQRAAAEIWRVLRPGGRLIATVPNVAYWRWRFDLGVHGRWNPFGDDLSLEQPWRDPHIRFFNPESLRRMLQSCRFDVVDLAGWGEYSLLAHVPRIRKHFRSIGPGPASRFLQRTFPSLLGLRLYVVALKCASTDDSTT